MLESGIAEASAKFERELEGVTKSMSEAADELSSQIAGAGGGERMLLLCGACTCTGSLLGLRSMCPQLASPCTLYLSRPSVCLTGLTGHVSAAANARFEDEVERGAQNWSRMSEDLGKTMVRCAGLPL